MHLKYLGTAAAEGVPALFCVCETCVKARAAGGRNIRSRSQAIVDGRLLIDYPPDTFMHTAQHGLDLPAITSLLITHAHEDHLYPNDFEMRKPGYAYTAGEPQKPLHIYASAASRKVIDEADQANLQKENVIVLHTVVPFVPFEVEGYTVTGLVADHDRLVEALFYLIEKDGKALLYANDTGYFPDETWEYLTEKKPQLDFVSLDCTGIAATEGYYGWHMSVYTNWKVRDRLKEMGCAAEHTQFCHHHFSHNGQRTYDEQCEMAEGTGFLVSYDGMEAEF